MEDINKPPAADSPNTAATVELTEYGDLIPRKKLSTIMDKREHIQKRVKKFLIPVLNYPSEPDDNGTIQSRKNFDDLPYFDNVFNGFVFSKSLIDKLFKDEKLDQLLVVLAADINKEENPEIVRPTVALIAGTVKVTKDEIQFIPPDIEDNFAAETPPHLAFKIPAPDRAHGDAFVFEIK